MNTLSSRQTASPVIIRDAQQEDAGAVVALAAALSQFEEVGEGAFSEEDFLKFGFGEGASFRVLVAEDTQSTQVIGFLMYYPGYDLASASHGSHLADVFVMQQARGKGAGHALVAELARRTLAAGGQWVSWTVLKKNRAAKKFYTNLGASNVAVDFMAWGASTLQKLAA